MSDKPNLSFLVPPSPFRVGGLDAAIEGLAGALETKGWAITTVEEGSPLPENTDLLHVHGIWRPKAAQLAKETTRRGIPYIVSPHGMLEPWARRSKRLKKSLYFYLVERANLARATTVLATSEQERRNLAAFSPRLARKCVAIPLGIDPPPEVPSRAECRRSLGLDQDEKILLYLSRIDRKKGLDVLLRALASTENVDIDRLVVVGDGDPAFLRELATFASQVSSSLPAVDWVGGVWGEEKWAYLKAADLFCLPTHSENFGFAVLEAALMGTPVLTTENTPWNEWSKGVEHITITRASTGSIGEALSEQVVRLPDDSSPSLAQWARENFLWEKVVSGYEKMYLKVLGHAPG